MMPDQLMQVISAHYIDFMVIAMMILIGLRERKESRR